MPKPIPIYLTYGGASIRDLSEIYDYDIPNRNLYWGCSEGDIYITLNGLGQMEIKQADNTNINIPSKLLYYKR